MEYVYHMRDPKRALLFLQDFHRMAEIRRFVEGARLRQDTAAIAEHRRDGADNPAGRQETAE